MASIHALNARGLATATASRAVTKQYDFLDASNTGYKLFAVRDGIPLADAFDQLSLLLANTQSVIDNVTDDSMGPNWAASQLLEMTHALVQSMHKGFIEHENTAPPL